MPGYIAAKTISLPVAAADVIRQKRFVKVTAAGGAEECDTANEASIGVSQEASPDGRSVAIPVAVLDGSVIEAEAGGAITAGDEITTDNQGRAVAASGTTTRVLGTATTTAASGEIVYFVGGSTGFAAQA